MAQFTQPDDEHQHAGQVMIEFRVGNACDGPFPSRSITRSRMMLVVGADLFLKRRLTMPIMLRPERDDRQE